MDQHKLFIILDKVFKYYSKVSLLLLLKVDLDNNKIIRITAKSKVRSVLSKITVYVFTAIIGMFYAQVFQILNKSRKSLDDVDTGKTAVLVFYTLGLSSLVPLMMLMTHFPEVLRNFLNPLQDLKVMVEGEKNYGVDYGPHRIM